MRSWWYAGLLALATAAAAEPANAQFFDLFGGGPQYRPRATPQYQQRSAPRAQPQRQRQQQGFLFWGDDDDDDDERPQRRQQRTAAPKLGPALLDGGPRPAISASAPPVVPFTSSYAAGSVVIDSGGRALYYVLDGNRAYRYSIAVGREGFSWAGVEKVSRKAAWPDWHPPAEMRERDPRLPEKMTGGLKNPLGAMAIYLGSTLYRIHGTNDARSIGSASSSGCFRMTNSNVTHLASLVNVGTTVHVLRSLPASVRRVASAN